VIIPDDVIEGWWGSSNCRCDNPQQFISEEYPKLMEIAGCDCLSADGRKDILECKTTMRKKLNEKLSTPQAREAAAEVSEIYKALETNNALGSAKGVFTDKLHSYYKSYPELKLVQDELRFKCHHLFSKLESAPAFDKAAEMEFSELVNMIGDMLFTNGNGVEKPSLINLEKFRRAIHPTELLAELNLFINSTFFLYTPMTPAECESAYKRQQIRRPEPNSKVIFNALAYNYKRHERLLSGEKTAAQTHLSTLLDSLKGCPLSPELKAKLAAMSS
jgi:hypothetical protein